MTLGCTTPDDVMKAIKDHGVQMIDLRFTDMFGVWHHTSCPPSALDADAIAEGLGFDGSAIPGFKVIEESDMLLMPDPTTAFLDPFTEHPTLVLICDIQDPVSHEFYSRDPRGIAKKAMEHLRTTGIADTAYFGPEAEFFVFDDVRYGQQVEYGSYHIDSIEGHWRMPRPEPDGKPNLGYKMRPRGGYCPVPPSDTLQDMRTEMVLLMERIGLTIEAHHHEVAAAGQGEIDFRFDTLVATADALMKYKYVVKNVARRRGKTATFMPKPLFGDNGSGMHTHQSLWRDGKPLFFDEAGYAGLSDTAKHYIGGLLQHAPAVMAFAAPTTNSYHRLVPRFTAPVNLAYSVRNRSAACRIPVYSGSPKAKRIEFRCPDPSCNPYITFAAMLMAGLDGIRNRIDPGEPVDKNIYDLVPAEMAEIPKIPASLDDALAALEADHEFLTEGDVFTEDFIATYIEHKREHDIKEMRLRPHPYEFVLYYDV